MPPIEIIDNFFKIEKLESSKLSIDNFIGYKILPENLLNVLKFLKENKELRFTILTDLFAADFPERDKRFEVVYSLLSFHTEYIGMVERTWGTETSKYPEEKKSTEIPLVAASERGPALKLYLC